MRVKIINLILLLASWLPIFSLTKDDNYGEIVIDSNTTVRSQLYYPLLQIWYRNDIM